MRRIISLLTLAAAMTLTLAAQPEGVDASGTVWTEARLDRAPAFAWTGERDGVRSLEFAGQDYRGKATRVYALYGAPVGASAAKPVPAIVLVHGGAGRAFPEWVRQWVARGYAALALDVGGADAPADAVGPRGFGGYKQIAEPLTDQWSFHAVANVINAHSLLRNFPEVDPSRTAIMGVSWGGYLTQLAVSFDHRFRAAVPVYGCGYRIEDDEVLQRFAHYTPEEKRRWSDNWDPASHLRRNRTPMLFVNGTEDKIFRLRPYHSTYRLIADEWRTVKMTVGFRHGQEPATSVREVERFIDSFCLPHVPPLLRVGAASVEGTRARARISNVGKLSRAVWWSTESPGPYHRDNPGKDDPAKTTAFRSAPARWTENGQLEVTLTPETEVGFFEVEDESGAKSTSEIWFR